MKKVQLLLVQVIRSIFIVTGIASVLFMAMDLSLVYRMMALLAVSILIAWGLSIVEDNLKYQIEQIKEKKSSTEQKILEKVFYNVKPCRNGWQINKMRGNEHGKKDMG